MRIDWLTPVEQHGGILLKRDDLYLPYGKGTVNGGKLRQCVMLLQLAKGKCKGVIACCSIHSPQAPITAAVAKSLNLPCYIFYGGTTKEKLNNYKMVQIARRYGAKTMIISRSGLHKILYGKAKQFADENDLFVVDYGFNFQDIGLRDSLITSNAKQAENIPKALDNLVVVCGRGLTSMGILKGLNMYSNAPKRIWLVATAPDRQKLINEFLDEENIKIDYNVADLFHCKGFKYEDKVKASIDGIVLHPNYEAKAYSWLKSEVCPIKPSEKTLLWIVGAEPKR